MRNSVSRSVPLAALLGLVAVVVSLPVLFGVHRALGLGNPPVTGLLLLGGTVVACFALAAAVGTSIGTAWGNAFVAAVLGLLIGVVACLVIVPFYGSLVVEGLTRDATGLVFSERERVETAARGVALSEGSKTFTAVREGRLREQLAEYREQAKNAATPEARAIAIEKAGAIATQIAQDGKTKGIALLKAGAARTSAFSLLLWALVGSPLVAALGCRQAKR